ncbi:MAG: extracellular solute-binding protein, partial [Candidatus Hydrogenedentota bacterium]
TGIDPKTGQKTWGYVIKGQDPVFQFMGFLYQNGGEFYNEEETEATFNSREGKEALRFLVDLHRVHNVSGPETMNNWLWNTFGPFLSPKNKYAIYETVPGMIKAGAIDRAGRIGVCTLPKRKRRGGLMGGSFLAINKKSLPEKKEAAFQLIKFLGQPQCQKWLVKQTASLSPRIDLWDWDYLKDHPEWKVGMKQFESSFPTPSAVWGRTYNILGEYIQNALVGDMTPEEALDQAAKEVNRLLEANTAATRRDPAEVKHEISVLNLMFWAVITIMIVFLVIWGWVSHRKRNVRSALIRELKTARPWFVFLSPVLLFLAVFLVYPLLDSLRLSFLAFDGINPLAVMGFKNYTFVLQNAKFWNAVWNTIYLALGGLLIMIPLAVVLAVLINEKVMGKTFFKVVYFMPVITSYVAISIVWQLILNPGETGILNNALSVLGIAPLGWLSDPSLSKPAIIIMDTWRWLGFVTMIMLAGLQGIPESLYEAARIDGAGAVQRFFHVTLPLLKPAITFVVLTHWISALQAFDQIYVLGGVRGGIQRSFQTIVSYLYEVGFVDQHFGVASAIAYILFFIIGVITAINAFWLKPHKGVEER